MESLDELEALCISAEKKVVEKIIHVIDEINPKHFLGKGKLNDLKHELSLKHIPLVIFNNDLSPTQIRNLESMLDVQVMSRTDLILDIFERRARTKEAKLQVELAFLTYMFPRLKRRWTHLSRIEGGIGLRGPGETQLEADKRLVAERIRRIKSNLKTISVQMETRRKRRKDQLNICLVGYTNVGKSSLIQLLSKKEAFVRDAPFATLDSAVRKIYLGNNISAILIDTIGFISRLPTELIASFESTLKEVQDAGLLLHVCDSASTSVFNQISSVNKVLKRLNSLTKPTIYVFNKIDMLESQSQAEFLKEHTNVSFISVKNQLGIDELKAKMKDFLEDPEASVFQQIIDPEDHLR